VIEAKRVKELEKEVNKCVGGFDSEFNGIVAWIDLLEFFKDYAALKVENEGLRREDSRSCDYRAAWGMCDRLDEVYELKTLAEKAEAEKAEAANKMLGKTAVEALAENERLRERAATLEIDVYARTGRLEKAEAQLAKQAPLVEAVMKGDYNQLAVDAEYFTQPDSKKVMFAALALREEKGKRKEPGFDGTLDDGPDMNEEGAK
jgi:hypothetical protein